MPKDVNMSITCLFLSGMIFLLKLGKKIAICIKTSKIDVKHFQEHAKATRSHISQTVYCWPFKTLAVMVQCDDKFPK